MSKLDEALATARKSIGVVAKRGKNTAQRYDYARAEDVIREAREALADANLVLTDEVVDMTVTEITSSNNNAGRMVDVKLTYRLAVADAEHGEQAPQRLDTERYFDWLGTGHDYPGDKAIYKAITGGHKYFLMHLLQIPIGDDPEDERAAKPKGKGASKGKAQKAADGPAAKPATVSEIGKGIEATGVGFDRLCTLIGSIGGDAPTINRGDSIAKAVRALSEPQAQQLLKLLEGEANE